MKRTHWKLAIVMALIAMLCATAQAAKDKKDKPKRTPAAKTAQAAESERKVTEDQVPPPALKTLKKMAGKAEITEFAEEIEHGSTFYEGSWKTKAGANMDVLVTKSGDLVEIEEQMPAKKLPPAALKAAQKLAGKNAEVASEKKTMILYEIKFTKDGAIHEVLLTPDGRVVEQEIEKGTSEDRDDEEGDDDADDEDDDEDGDDEDEDEDEEHGDKVSLNDVPKAVRAAIRKNLDGGRIEDIEQIKSGKKVIFEVDIIIEGKEVELRLGADGKVLSRKVESDEDDEGDEDADDDEEDDDEDGDDDDEDDDEDGDNDEEEVSARDVPSAVRATIRKLARGGTVEEITKEDENGKVIYEVEIKIGDKEYELEIAANGKLLKKELADDEEDDDDEDEDDDEDGDDEDKDD